MSLTTISRLSAEACLYCQGPVYREDDEYDSVYCRPPVCRECVQREERSHYASRTEKALDWIANRLFDVTRCHIDTGGFDPYAGERYTLTRGKLRIVVECVISPVVRINGRRFYETSRVWKWFGEPLFDAFEAVRKGLNYTLPEYDMGFGPHYWE